MRPEDALGSAANWDDPHGVRAEADHHCPRCHKQEYMAGKRGGCAECRKPLVSIPQRPAQAAPEPTTTPTTPARPKRAERTTKMPTSKPTFECPCPVPGCSGGGHTPQGLKIHAGREHKHYPGLKALIDAAVQPIAQAAAFEKSAEAVAQATEFQTGEAFTAPMPTETTDVTPTDVHLAPPASAVIEASTPSQWIPRVVELCESCSSPAVGQDGHGVPRCAACLRESLRADEKPEETTPAPADVAEESHDEPKAPKVGRVCVDVTAQVNRQVVKTLTQTLIRAAEEKLTITSERDLLIERVDELEQLLTHPMRNLFKRHSTPYATAGTYDQRLEAIAQWAKSWARNAALLRSARLVLKKACESYGLSARDLIDAYTKPGDR